MDRIPQTILEDIIELVANDVDPSKSTAWNPFKKAVAPLATVSRRFQRAVERITFADLSLTRHDIRAASAILGRFSRWLLVRDLTFDVHLPQYGGTAYSRLESADDKANNSYVFTANIIAYFRLLSEWPVQSLPTHSNGAHLSLYIQVYSCSDKVLHDYGNLLYENGASANDVLSVEIWRYHRSTLRLNDFITLPSLRHVPIAEIDFPSSFYRRNIDASSLARMTAVMNLEVLRNVYWSFGDVEKKDLSLRIAHRRGLADAIDALPNLDIFGLDAEYFAPHNHDYSPPILHHPTDEEDPVSSSIRRLSQRTRLLTVDGVLGSTELFWPKKLSINTPEPYWESLEELIITFHPVTPDGKWLLERDDDAVEEKVAYVDLCPEPDEIRGEEDDMWNLWRFVPNQTRMNKFYQVVGRALANMPKLCYMQIESIEYIGSPTEDRSTEHQFVFEVFKNRKAVASWYSRPGYEPSEAVKKVWRKSAYERALDLEIYVESLPLNDASDEDDEDDEEEGDDENYEDVVTVIEIS